MDGAAVYSCRWLAFSKDLWMTSEPPWNKPCTGGDGVTVMRSRQVGFVALTGTSDVPIPETPDAFCANEA